MTPEQNKQLEEMFQRYGNPADDIEIHIRDYLTKPCTIYDPARLQREDADAQRTIESLESMIEKMKLYRLALCDQYNMLSTAPVQKVVRLQRRKDSYTNKVFYWLLTFDRYEDGHDEQTSSTKYTGTDRKQAFADFAAYKKSHPGIIAEEDTKKAHWEK